MPDDFVVKVCGVTTVEDAQAAVEAGANALGFNFYAGSPRFLTAAKAAAIIDGVRGSYLRVGVFVNANEAEVRAVVSEAGLDVAQLHGSAAAVGGVRNWRAIQAASSLHASPDSSEQPEAYLIDTVSPGFGGSGQTFDWSLATNFPGRAIIAGGLDAANVAEAIRVAEPWGVDACSRLESRPGRKDYKRVTAFVHAARAAFLLKQQVAL